MTHRIGVIVGTRPEAIKVAPVVMRARASDWCEVVVIATGQHHEVVDQMLDVFKVKVDYRIPLDRGAEPLALSTARILAALGEVIETSRVDGVLVQGDTTSSLCGALAGFYAAKPVFHLEAGLRTGRRFDPFPEEINRRLISQLAVLHFAPTRVGHEALVREGVSPERILVTGNTVVDSLKWVLATMPRVTPEGISGPYALVTMHRREAWEGGIAEVADAVRDSALLHSEFSFVWPVHPNPLVAKTVLARVSGISNIHVCGPMSYPALCWALAGCEFVVTDSGGIQEEAPSVGAMVLVARETSERAEGIAAGAAQLVGRSRAGVHAAIETFVRRPIREKVRDASNPYGDGFAASRVLDGIQRYFAHELDADARRVLNFTS